MYQFSTEKNKIGHTDLFIIYVQNNEISRFNYSYITKI